ncbi:MAG TPA: T9SS type A sorting domain-containing protein [Chitinophagaceae bacterium]|jgi:type IX secretion system substrate protein|nr:T9SS type A sorting domain-containing protein [Chitinophagaceae bacterium]
MRNTLLLLILLASISARGQITTPVVRANFGVDGDLRANYLTGLGVTGSADDWFYDGTVGSGRHVIDTTGAAAIIKGYNTDASPWPRRMATFFRGMSLPTFTVFNNRLWLDALFVRDYHGNDTTVYTSGADKNGQSPAFWSGGIQGIPDKNDILDVMMHVRRAGPNTTDSLWMFGGISIVNTTGNRYFDFEMYQTDISYDRVSQKWYGYGPDAGHTSWKFDATGKVISPGDIIFNGQFQSSALTSIEARIWVSKADWQTVTPTAFNWSGQFDGDGSGAVYGYASISPKAAGAFYTGLGSPSSTWSGPFGLVLQDNSLSYTNPGPASTSNGKYVSTQFIEFSVNLTKLGLDPVTTFGGDVCGTPFNRLVVKTRASSAFTAELKDFVAPIDLFLAPRAQALADVPLFCGAIGVSHIEVQNPSASSTYTWTTPDGHIVGTTTGPNIVVDSPGTYMVTQRLSAGCNPYAYDTVAVIYNANCGTLDNTVLDFKGAISNNLAKLDWTIADNENVSYFEIERSFDGRTFEGVNQTVANGQIKSSASYSAYDNLDHLSLPNAIYYRLKIVKVSGGVSYSQVIRIPYGKSLTKFSIIPNPVHDVMQVAINSSNDGSIDLRIFDMAGKIVRTIKTNVQSGVNVISFDQLSRLQEGTYIVVVYTGQEILRQKIVLVK